VSAYYGPTTPFYNLRNWTQLGAYILYPTDLEWAMVCILDSSGGYTCAKETLETQVIASQLFIQSSFSMKFELMSLKTHEKIFQRHEKSGTLQSCF